MAHWVVPTFFLPLLVGTIVSFRPAPTSSSATFDPLTASIVRLAAQLAYPYPTLGVKGMDILGPKVRVLNAGVGLAFAFAEAIARAPAPFFHGREERDEIVLDGFE